MADQISRRQFVKNTGAAVVGASVLPRVVLSKSAVDIRNAPAVDRKQLISALGDTLIPTAQGYPGYRRLEQYGITEEVFKGLQDVPQQDWNVFNACSGEFFSGKSFVDLSGDQRAEFLNLIVDSFPPETFNAANLVEAPHGGAAKGAGSLPGKFEDSVVQTLQRVFRLVRARVFTTFYRNFPEDHIARDKNKIPILPPGDLHQIVNPNTEQLLTGWDVAGFPGPLSWEEEEQRRAQWMKIRWNPV